VGDEGTGDADGMTVARGGIAGLVDGGAAAGTVGDEGATAVAAAAESAASEGAGIAGNVRSIASGTDGAGMAGYVRSKASGVLDES